MLPKAREFVNLVNLKFINRGTFKSMLRNDIKMGRSAAVLYTNEDIARTLVKDARASSILTDARMCFADLYKCRKETRKFEEVYVIVTHSTRLECLPDAHKYLSRHSYNIYLVCTD